MMVAPLFPFMAHAAALRVGNHLLAARLSTRASQPARYLLSSDRVTGTALDHQVVPSRRLIVWGRGFSRGYCSLEELERWQRGDGGVAIKVEAFTVDLQLRQAFNEEG